MVNVRLIYPKNLSEAIDEIRKIETDTNTIHCMASKTVPVCVVVEDISCFAANVVKQEMLNCGGYVLVSKDSVDNGLLENVTALIVGNLDQVNKVIMKLVAQPGVLADVGSEIKFATQAVKERELAYYCCRGHKLEIGKKTYIMGILNITTDSFSGDGLLVDVPNTAFNEIAGETSSGPRALGRESVIEAACHRAEKMVADGADIIDVGGESTRPGYTSVDDREELDRIFGVVEKLVKTLDVPISVDTSKLYVAEHVLKAGAHIINDVTGLIKEPKIAKLAASYGAGVIAMHNPDKPFVRDIFSCITQSLRKSVDIATKSGLRHDNIILDPGIGFGTTLAQNLEIMRRLDELKCLGYPVLLGTSRKSMIGNVLGLPVNERVEGTAASVALGIAKGVDFIRVHDVKEMYRVAKMSDAIIRGSV